MPEKLYISWDEFHRHTKQLAQKIKGKGSYNKIIAVSRGGLIPAGILAYELDIRNVEVVNMSSYDGDKQRTDDEITIHTSVGDVDERTLVIDDLSDTGKTFKLLRPMFPKATLAAVYAKNKARLLPIFMLKIFPISGLFSLGIKPVRSKPWKQPVRQGRKMSLRGTT